jgi:hypothetical protein
VKIFDDIMFVVAAKVSNIKKVIISFFPRLNADSIGVIRLPIPTVNVKTLPRRKEPVEIGHTVRSVSTATA